MGYYRTCPRCGAHLDPGERCDDCLPGGAAGQKNRRPGIAGTAAAEKTAQSFPVIKIKLPEKGAFVK